MHILPVFLSYTLSSFYMTYCLLLVWLHGMSIVTVCVAFVSKDFSTFLCACRGWCTHWLLFKYVFLFYQKGLCFVGNWLAGGFKTLLIFTPTWGNDPIWLIFFRWVETTQPAGEFLQKWWMKLPPFFSGPRCSAFLDHNLSKNPQKDWTDNPPELFDDFLTIVFLDMCQSVNLSLVLCWYVCVYGLCLTQPMASPGKLWGVT